ncbi:hypothetical protein FB451DRAFT_1510781 [Mycena latifolia]|nr:hypothetical protein FB451DRAFT_1510781 [Mycena latifolia]
MPTPALQWPLPPRTRTITVGHTAAPLEPLQHESATRWHHALCIRPLPPSALRYAAANPIAPYPARRAPCTSASTFRVSASMCGVVGERNAARSVTPPVSAALRLSVMHLARAPLEHIGTASDVLARSWELRRGLDGTCWRSLRTQKPAATRHRDAAAFTVAEMNNAWDGVHPICIAPHVTEEQNRNGSEQNIQRVELARTSQKVADQHAAPAQFVSASLHPHYLPLPPQEAQLTSRTNQVDMSPTVVTPECNLSANGNGKHAAAKAQKLRGKLDSTATARSDSIRGLFPDTLPRS